MPPYAIPVDAPVYADAQTVTALAAMSIESMNTVSATTAGPNSVVATSSNGALPASVLYVTNTLAGLKANPPKGIAICFATDVGPHGSFFLYFNTGLVGDSGFTLLGGS